MKKLVSMLLCLCLVLSLTAFAAAEGYTAGTYEGRGAGRNGDIVVSVTFSAARLNPSKWFLTPKPPASATPPSRAFRRKL